MPLKNGDFVLIDYSLKVKDTGEVFDVTIEDQAKAANVYSPEQSYAPKLVVVGQGWMIKGIDEVLLTSDEGQEKDLEIPPAKAFGERDGGKVKIVPARELTKQGVTPRPGARIEVGGQLATIRSVGSGRVIIDYNHPLAGKTIVTKIYVRKVISEPEQRIRELIHRRIVNVPKEKFMVSNLGSMITIEMPEEAFTVEDIQFAKKGLAKEIGKYFPEAATIQFTESYVLKQPEKPKPAEKVEEKPIVPAKEPELGDKGMPEAQAKPSEPEKPVAKEGAKPRKKSQPRAQ